ncbi:MAG: T9SS type A sorting domain-containing protein [Deferribacteres bacterium]|nr:T9SS type A sorting domain-containing protein [Deferribacteres bacterium]
MKKILLLFGVIFLSHPSLLAQQWRLVGLDGRKVNEIKSDPQDASILYASCTSSITNGNKGGLYKSTDGGATWEVLIDDNIKYFAIHPDSSNIMYACRGYRVFKTTDGWKNWFYADSGAYDVTKPSDMFGPLVINPDNPDELLMSKTTGAFWPTRILYKSEDGGSNWRELAFPPHGASAMVADPFLENTVYAGDKATIYAYKSTDFGESWEQWQDPGSDGRDVEDIGVVSIDSIIYHFMVRGLSGFFISQDGGKTWVQNNSGLPHGSILTKVCTGISSIFIIRRKLASSESGIYESQIKKISWKVVGNDYDFQGLGVVALYYSSYFNKLFAGTDNGLYTYDPTLNIKSNATSALSFFSLKQNHPNPFRETTTIEYELTRPAHVVLDLFDITGKRIKRMVNAQKTQGIHNVNFSADQLSAGVYFYRIVVDSVSEIKKLLVLK